jgi:hypothetical protein
MLVLLLRLDPVETKPSSCTQTRDYVLEPCFDMFWMHTNEEDEGEEENKMKMEREARERRRRRGNCVFGTLIFVPHNFIPHIYC